MAFPERGPDKRPLYTGPVSTVYWIGVAAGLGAALGLLAGGLLTALPAGRLLALLVGTAAGVGAGLLLGGWGHAAAGGLGGLLASFGSVRIVEGALRRGGTAAATAALVAVAAVVTAVLAFVPLLGYVEALVPALLATRARRRAGDRYAGLRVLARD
jgi:hypothetical protein